MTFSSPDTLIEICPCDYWFGDFRMARLSLAPAFPLLSASLRPDACTYVRGVDLRRSGSCGSASSFSNEGYGMNLLLRKLQCPLARVGAYGFVR